MDNKLPLVDIVIISWNSFEYLKLCLDSIKKYTLNISYRIIIIDNGSTDETREFLKKINSDKIIIKKNKINLGYPKALSQGYHLSKSEFVCLMNDDVVVSPYWLSNLVKVMQKNPDIGILGPVRPGAHFIHPYTNKLSKVVLEESKDRHASPVDQLKHFTQSKKFTSFVKDYKEANGPTLVKFNTLPDIVSTCCALVRRKAIDESGGIVDKTFSIYGGDDVDLSWRLVKSGFSLGITSKSYIHHFEHISMDRNNVDRKKYLDINAKHLYKKWEKEIKEYLISNKKDGFSNDQILKESWLIKRVASAVGKRFWSGT